MKIENGLALDLEAVFKFCFESNDKNSNSEITELYANDDDAKGLVLMSKQLREVKDNDATSKENIRYDLVKTLISYLFDIDEDEMTLGDSVILNTLMSEGMLKEIE